MAFHFDQNQAPSIFGNLAYLFIVYLNVSEERFILYIFHNSFLIASSSPIFIFSLFAGRGIYEIDLERITRQNQQLMKEIRENEISLSLMSGVLWNANSPQSTTENNGIRNLNQNLENSMGKKSPPLYVHFISFQSGSLEKY